MSKHPSLSAECVDPSDSKKAAEMLRQIAAIRDDSAADFERRFGEGHWLRWTTEIWF